MHSVTQVQELYKQAQESQSLGPSQGNMAHSVYMQQQNQQQASAIQQVLVSLTDWPPVTLPVRHLVTLYFLQALQSGRGLQPSAAPAAAAGVKLKRLPFYNLHGVSCSSCHSSPFFPN